MPAAADAARRVPRAAPRLELLQGLEPLKTISRSSFGRAVAYAQFAAGKVGTGNVARAVAFPFDATDPARVAAEPHRSIDARRVIEGGYDPSGYEWTPAAAAPNAGPLDVDPRDLLNGWDGQRNLWATKQGELADDELITRIENVGDLGPSHPRPEVVRASEAETRYFVMEHWSSAVPDWSEGHPTVDAAIEAAGRDGGEVIGITRAPDGSPLALVPDYQPDAAHLFRIHVSRIERPATISGDVAGYAFALVIEG